MTDQPIKLTDATLDWLHAVVKHRPVVEGEPQQRAGVEDEIVDAIRALRDAARGLCSGARLNITGGAPWKWDGETCVVPLRLVLKLREAAS